MKKYIGIDIGGTTVKGMIIDEAGAILAEDSIRTGAQKGGDAMCRNIVALVKSLAERARVPRDEMGGAGVGCPGVIDGSTGVLVYSANLNLRNFTLAERLKKALGLEVRATNDANAAALGEAKFGAGRNYTDSILVTLGTGVGGGIITGGKLFEGYKSAGAELGHMVIVRDGAPCTCGRRGCLEAYASATALMKMTKKAMKDNPSSAMNERYTAETVTGRTAFEFPDDPTANTVVSVYINNLACGLVNLANIFRPQVIMLGGGVSGQRERLTAPLQAIMDKELFGGTLYAPVKVVCATLGNRAGAYGAASLMMD